jgi:hypothetical protein
LQRALQYGLVSAGVALVVGVMGGLISGAESRQAVWFGVVAAYLIQLVLFVALFVVAFASKPLLAHGLGMLGRLMAVGTFALFGVPWVGLPAAPLLFSLVAVLFVTTLFEPLFLLGAHNER